MRNSGLRLLALVGVSLTLLPTVLQAQELDRSTLPPEVVDRDTLPAHADDDELTAREYADAPWFGGRYYQDNQEYVHVVGADRRVAARRRFPAATLLPATFTFAQLLTWRNLAIAAMEDDMITMVDLDERVNRIHVGILPDAPDGTYKLVEQGLLARGLPEGSFVLGPWERPVPMADLRNRILPVSGATQISSGNIFNYWNCTLGFNAEFQGVKGFVTNSHCTQGYFVNNFNDYTQGDFILHPDMATEHSDPAAFSGGACPSGKICRYSDSIFARVWDQNSVSPNIMLTTGFWSITLAPQPNDHAPVQFYDTAGIVLGNWYNKTGRTTGWTAGFATNTCVSVSPSTRTDIVFLCQAYVAGGVDSGDSGSPVWRGEANGKVSLHGILWGGGGGSFVFSPMTGIRASTDLTTALNPLVVP